MVNRTDIPGVTFNVAESNYKGVGGTIVGNVHLTAKIEDLELWKEVIKKLEGYTIYTVNDLAATMVEVTQKRLVEVEKEREADRRRYRAQLESLGASNSFLDAENKQLKQQLASLGVHIPPPAS